VGDTSAFLGSLQSALKHNREHDSKQVEDAQKQLAKFDSTGTMRVKLMTEFINSEEGVKLSQKRLLRSPSRSRSRSRSPAKQESYDDFKRNKLDAKERARRATQSVQDKAEAARKKQLQDAQKAEKDKEKQKKKANAKKEDDEVQEKPVKKAKKPAAKSWQDAPTTSPSTSSYASSADYSNAAAVSAYAYMDPNAAMYYAAAYGYPAYPPHAPALPVPPAASSSNSAVPYPAMYPHYPYTFPPPPS